MSKNRIMLFLLLVFAAVGCEVVTGLHGMHRVSGEIEIYDGEAGRGGEGGGAGNSSTCIGAGCPK